MEYIILWVAVSIVALLIDAITSSFFFAGFSVGGICALIAYTSEANFLTQFIVFGLVSAVAIFIEYFWFRKKIKRSIPITPRMEEEYIGKSIIAEEDIDEKGRIKLGGIYWTVENQGEPVKKGEKVKVISIKGNKIIIKK